MRTELWKKITRFHVFIWPNIVHIKVAVCFMIGYALFCFMNTVIHHPTTQGYESCLFSIIGMGCICALIILGPASYRSYRTLSLLKAQEEVLHVDFKHDLTGRVLEGTPLEPMYFDNNWFVSYGGRYVNVFHKNYIVGVSDVQKYDKHKEVEIQTRDGRRVKFTVSNTYDQPIWAFVRWLQNSY